VDKKGTLDYPKFASLTLQLQMVDNDDYLRYAFSHFDKDDNGFIDLAELTQAMSEESVLDSGLVHSIMNEVDSDKVRLFDAQSMHLFLCFFFTT
jgi:calcium-dependent protein kinase